MAYRSFIRCRPQRKVSLECAAGKQGLSWGREGEDGGGGGEDGGGGSHRAPLDFKWALRSAM